MNRGDPHYLSGEIQKQWFSIPWNQRPMLPTCDSCRRWIRMQEECFTRGWVEEEWLCLECKTIEVAADAAVELLRADEG